MTLFPEVTLPSLSDSIIQRTRAAGLVEVIGHQLRDWSEEKTGGSLMAKGLFRSRDANDVGGPRKKGCAGRVITPPLPL